MSWDEKELETSASINVTLGVLSYGLYRYVRPQRVSIPAMLSQLG